jgi:hypothetical protein|tara:strand:- start:50 stop:424 length:375 start_codon:yes stop_codon:yes gene_type:complete
MREIDFLFSLIIQFRSGDEVLLRVVAVSLLAMPFAAVGFSAEGDDLKLEMDSHVQHVVPPAMVDTQVGTFDSEPLDFSQVEITTLTPADKYVSATTPLMVGLVLGTVSLVVYTLVSQSNPSTRD